MKRTVPIVKTESDKSGCRICLLGARLHVGNLGCRALTVSLIGGIQKVRPDAEFCLLYGNRTPETVEVEVNGRVTPVRVVNYRLSPKARFGEHLVVIVLLACVYRLIALSALRKRIRGAVPWIREVLDADLVGQIHGGDSFTDIYGPRRLVLQTIQNAIVFILGKDLVLLPQTYGPYKSKLARRLAHFTLSRSSAIYARDKKSLQVVREMLGAVRSAQSVHFCPDVAFGLEPKAPVNATIVPELPGEDGAPIIGLNINGLLYNGGYGDNNLFDLRSDYKTTIQRLLEEIAAQTDARVLLVPHVLEGGTTCDQRATEEVWQRIPEQLRGRVHRVLGDYDQSEIKSVIGACDFFIGSRMHACIAAISQDIPTVGVAYSRKFVGVFETVGVEHLALDLHALCEEEVVTECLKQFRCRDRFKPILAKNVPLAKSDIEEMFNSLILPGAKRDQGARLGAEVEGAVFE